MYILNNILKLILDIIKISQYISNISSYNLRSLSDNNQDQENQNAKDNQKKQLIELFIYLAILIGIIILILGGYNIYKKYVEKQLIREMNREIENINFLNSISIASQEERKAYSYNDKIDNKYLGSEIESYNAQNNSFDYNHEERMEQIRRKYGNKMLIKILIKQQIDNVIYNTNLGFEYGDNCTICVNNFIENMEIYRTPCEHIFHKDCFNKYLKKINNKNKLTCPNCNQNLLINKKFLKLRQKVEGLNKLKIKTQNVTNKERINHIETEKKVLSENENISSNNRNYENINLENNDTELDKNKEPIFIIKKRKVEFNNNKRLATVDVKYINIYNPSEYIDKKINEKEEEVLYISNSNEDDAVDEKENENEKNKKNIGMLKSVQIEKKKRNENNILNINIVKDKKKKLSIDKIKFSDPENDFIYNHPNSKELNSKRELLNNKIIFNDNNIETTK